MQDTDVVVIMLQEVIKSGAGSRLGRFFRDKSDIYSCMETWENFLTQSLNSLSQEYVLVHKKKKKTVVTYLICKRSIMPLIKEVSYHRPESESIGHAKIISCLGIRFKINETSFFLINTNLDTGEG